MKQHHYKPTMFNTRKPVDFFEGPCAECDQPKDDPAHVVPEVAT